MRRISWIDQGMRSDVLALRSTWFFWASACWPRHVDQHQVHGPAAKPVLSLRRPARQRNFMIIEAAHSRPMHRNLATVEADLALRRAPAGGWRGRTGLGRLKFSPQSRSKEAAQPSVTTRRAPSSGPATPIPLALIQRLRSVQVTLIQQVRATRSLSGRNPYFGPGIRSMPMYGRSTSGIVTEPSAC